jgi:hypothetical protein
MEKPFRQIQLDMTATEALNIVQKAGAWCGDYRTQTCSFSDLNYYYEFQIDSATNRVIRKTAIKKHGSVFAGLFEGYRLLVP